MDETTNLPKAGDILGCNKRGYPMQYPGTGVIGIMDVTVGLVAGDVEDYAAYIGIGEQDWVARHGNKLSFKEACLHFPIGLEEERYRR